VDADGVLMSIWDAAPLQGIKKLSDFAAVLVLTDNADTGRAWVEQTSLNLDGTPLLMIVSAQVEPMIRPYFDSGQIDGLVNGLADAKIYEGKYNRPGLAQIYWDSYSIGMLVAVLLIVAGALWGALDGWRAKMGKASEEA
jgi:hypothetical protein